MDGARRFDGWGRTFVTALVAAIVATGVTTVFAQTDGERQPEPPAPRQTIAEDLDVEGILEIVPPSDDARLRLTDPSGQIWEIQTDLDDFAVLDLSGGAFPFFISDGAPNNALTVDADGDVGLGVFDPNERLHIRENGPARIRVENTSTSQWWSFGINNAGDLFFLDESDVRLRVFSDGRIRYKPVDTPPAGISNAGDIYNDTSGALCWYDGASWAKVIGAGSCS